MGFVAQCVYEGSPFEVGKLPFLTKALTSIVIHMVSSKISLSAVHFQFVVWDAFLPRHFSRPGLPECRSASLHVCKTKRG